MRFLLLLPALLLIGFIVISGISYYIWWFSDDTDHNDPTNWMC